MEEDKEPEKKVVLISESIASGSNERNEKMISTERDTYERLKNDPDIQQHFSQYASSWVDDFIRDYAHQKAMVLEYGPMYQQIGENQYLKYAERAEACLAEIQMKKLLDVMRQWNAEQLHIDEIEYSIDFKRYYDNIFHCPFITPIQSDEFDLYLKYAESDHFDLENELRWYSCDEYLDLVPNDENDIDLPEWISYHNLISGASQYLVLPRIRTEREEFYFDLYHNERSKKENAAPYDAPASIEEFIRTKISIYDYQKVIDFVKKFEDANYLNLFNAYVEYGHITFLDFIKQNNNDYLNERVTSIMHSLSSYKQLILPIEASKDWREGLIKAFEKWEQQQVVNQLPIAYDNYLFKLQANIAITAVNDDRSFHYAEIEKGIRKQIWGGMKLNGEDPEFYV